MSTSPGPLQMKLPSPEAAPAGLRTVLGLRRIAVMLLVAVPIALLISIDSETRFATWLARSVIVGTGALVAFGLAESWPRTPAALDGALGVPAPRDGGGDSLLGLRRVLDHRGRCSGVHGQSEALRRLRSVDGRGHLLRRVDRAGGDGPATRRPRACADARVRARTPRTRAPGDRGAHATAAVADPAALPVQHAGEHPGAGRGRLAACAAGAREPDRVPEGGRAAARRDRQHARARGRAGARVPGADADAHARPPALRARRRSVGAVRSAVRRPRC